MNLFDYPLELNETAQRHRRNLLVASTIIGFIGATPGMTLSDLSVLGLSLEKASASWVWGGAIAFIMYFAVTFWVDASWCWSKWAVEARPLFGGKLRGLFGFTVAHPSPDPNRMSPTYKLLLRCDPKLISIDKKTETTAKEAIANLKQHKKVGNNAYFASISTCRYIQTDTHGNTTEDETPTLKIAIDQFPVSTQKVERAAYPIISFRKFRRHVLLFLIWQWFLPLGMAATAITLCVAAIAGITPTAENVNTP